MDCLLGIDIGTSATKAVLVEVSGKIIGAAQSEYPMSQPFPGWAEQDPEDWWKAVVSVIQELLKASGNNLNLLGIGLTGQMHGSVVLDAQGEVIRPAILWCDQRTGEACRWIEERVGLENLYKWTQNPALPGFTAPKLIWMREHEPEAYSRISHVLLPKDYIRWRLTGRMATEVSDASGTLLLDVKNRSWSMEMLEALNIPRNWLPDIFESPEITGRVTPETAAITGLLEGIPVVGGGGDQAAGAVGLGVIKPGVLSLALGTSGVVFATTDLPQTKTGSTLHAFCHAVPGQSHYMGVMLAAGASFRWFRDQLAFEENLKASLEGGDVYSLLTAEAAKVNPGADGLLFLPYLLGERTPYPDPEARGGFIGLNMRHGKAHMVRAVLEGVAFGLYDGMLMMEEAGVKVEEIRVSGGGAKSLLWCQIFANVFNKQVTNVNSTEGPAFGAALLAGTGIGVFKSVEDACNTTIRVSGGVDPVPGEVERYRKLFKIYRTLYPTLQKAMHDLSAFEREN